jgi:hypothetical protein
MNMLQHIIDSATGETLGNVNIAGMEDEAILDWLCRKGYLAGSPDEYEINRSYPFAIGEIVVLDMDTQKPVLKLELPDESESKAA